MPIPERIHSSNMSKGSNQNPDDRTYTSITRVHWDAYGCNFITPPLPVNGGTLTKEEYDEWAKQFN